MTSERYWHTVTRLGTAIALGTPIRRLFNTLAAPMDDDEDGLSGGPDHPEPSGLRDGELSVMLSRRQ